MCFLAVAAQQRHRISLAVRHAMGTVVGVAACLEALAETFLVEKVMRRWADEQSEQAEQDQAAVIQDAVVAEIIIALPTLALPTLVEPRAWMRL